jgi:hypothetical protein
MVNIRQIWLCLCGGGRRAANAWFKI